MKRSSVSLHRALSVVFLLAGLLLWGSAGAEPDPVVETGFQVGTALGAEGTHFSNYQGIIDAGFLVTGRANSPLRLGITGYAALGDDDLLLGIKSRLRLNYSREWSSDLGMGAVLLNGEGGSSVTRFIASHSLNHRWLSLRTETTVRTVPDRIQFVGPQPTTIEGGTEVGLYGGVALREAPGWIGAGLGATAAVLYFAILLITNPPS